METFSAQLAICAGNSSITGEFPARRSVTRSFDIFFYLRLDERLSKQSWGWWFDMLSRPLWRHCNASVILLRPGCVKHHSALHYELHNGLLSLKILPIPSYDGLLHGIYPVFSFRFTCMKVHGIGPVTSIERGAYSVRYCVLSRVPSSGIHRWHLEIGIPEDKICPITCINCKTEYLYNFEIS